MPALPRHARDGKDSIARAFFLAVRESGPVQVFGRRQSRINPHARATGVGKAPRQEIAVGGSAAVRRALWGFSRGAGLEEVGEKRLRRPVCCKPRMIALG